MNINNLIYNGFMQKFIVIPGYNIVDKVVTFVALAVCNLKS